MKRNRGKQYDEDGYQPPTKRTTKKRAKRSPSLRVTRLMKLDTALRAVFETVELLENIVVQLPPRDVIVCERVCRQFQQVIRSSHKIQRKLFRMVDDSGEKWTVRLVPTPHTSGLWSRSVEHRFELGPASHVVVDDSQSPHQVSQLNEAIFATDESRLGADRIEHARSVQSLGGTEVRPLPEIQHILTAMCKGEAGSWVNMHITSPPCQSVRVRLRLRLSSTQVCRVDKHIISPSGVTLGELARQLSASTGGCEFGRGNARVLIRTAHGMYEAIKDCSGPRLSTFIAAWESKTGHAVCMDSGSCKPWLRLHNTVLPTDEEMEEVHGRASKSKD